MLVFLHHPPFTNSMVTGDDADVTADLVPAFLAARKTLAMIAGHEVVVRGFAKGETGVRELDRFALPFRARDRSQARARQA